MPATAEQVEMEKNLDIANNAATIPTLIQWIVLLISMLTQKDSSKFSALIVIAILIIVS